MKVRLVEVDDAPALLRIYNPEVLETTNTFDLVARTSDEQVEWIEAHRAAHPCLVAVNEEDGLGEIGARSERLLGFAVLSTFRDRPAYATTVENSVYVLRASRGRGVGEALLRALVDAARDLGFHCLVARIVGENEGSIRLHEKCGFTLVGTEIEVGRKHGQWLDVVEYQYVMDAAN
ncbi:MAG TPA: GNAT family N-acetyltransferase [Acidimicrobiales bacterium]|nr:GNAT family N-acetyltransferase [Acidimicrobiales bacterium]